MHPDDIALFLARMTYDERAVHLMLLEPEDMAAAICALACSPSLE